MEEGYEEREPQQVKGASIQPQKIREEEGYEAIETDPQTVELTQEGELDAGPDYGEGATGPIPEDRADLEVQEKVVPARTVGDVVVSVDEPVAEEVSSPAAMLPSEMASRSMESLMHEVTEQYRSPRRGDILEGTIVRVDKDGILVNIGTKSEGIIPAYEIQSFTPEEQAQIRVGSEILVYVFNPEDQNGHVVISLMRARAERSWRNVQKHMAQGDIIEAEVIDYNKGGLIVNVDNIRGFVPMSQVVGLRQNMGAEVEIESKLGAMVGQRIPLKILEVNRRRSRLILSERAAIQERRSQRKEQLLAELREGEIRRGKVSSICDFGAFIDLGGADGLVHLSELSWSPVAHPSSVLRVGEEVDVYVLGVDREKKRIALSLRRIQPEPWARVSEKYNVGDLLEVTITKLANFGAFARLENGIEGLIHISELADGRVVHPRNIVKEGDCLSARIIRLDPARRRIGLSLRQAREEAVGVEIREPVAVKATEQALGEVEEQHAIVEEVSQTMEDVAE
ncbi:MAG: S1 RNA-binding domain-containing protein [Chloroflexi bacterium]|nr:S1 RNA-binding domain-containing protein [Chloroflexota bacterium]MCL5075101.1 S1 RNA-binding domain-containing protein [Chloroflexota bacterium]